MGSVTTHGPLPVPTPADRPYWDSAREGKLRLPRCGACGHLFFPPGARCPECGSKDLHWEDLSGRGKIWSWVVFHRQYFPDMPPPYTVLRVQLEEGPFLIANLVDVGGREPAIDAPVQVVFQDAGELILPQFTLV